MVAQAMKAVCVTAAFGISEGCNPVHSAGYGAA
jgi:hypothetical protein